MTVIGLVGATSLEGALTFAFAFLTWRRALARRALIGASRAFCSLSHYHIQALSLKSSGPSYRVEITADMLGRR